MNYNTSKKIDVLLEEFSLMKKIKDFKDRMFKDKTKNKPKINNEPKGGFDECPKDGLILTIGDDMESKKLAKDPEFVKALSKAYKTKITYPLVETQLKYNWSQDCWDNKIVDDLLIEVSSLTESLFQQLERICREDCDTKLTPIMKSKILQRFTPYQELGSVIGVYDKKLKKIVYFNRNEGERDNWFMDMKEAEWTKWLGVKLNKDFII